MKLRVLLLEDDYLQRRNICEALETESEAEVQTKSTESEFRKDFEQIAMNPPDVAVLDLMVRWANPTREWDNEPDQMSRSPEIAGLRCADLLRNDPRTQKVKVILYSVLGSEDIGAKFPEGVTSVVKETDFRDLLEAVANAVAEPPPK